MSGPEAGPRPTGTLALTVGAAVGGLLAYAFFATVTRALGAGPAAPFALLWAVWTYASAALTFPVQHWATRAVVVSGGEGEVRAALPAVAGAATALAVVAGVVSHLARGVLFPGGGGWFPLLVAATTLGAAATGLVRGVLAARGRLVAVAVTLVGENALRTALALLLALGAAGPLGAADPGPAAYGACLVVGYVACLAWPSVWRLHPGPRGAGGARPVLAVLSAASAGQLVGHAALTSGPVVLAALGGAPVAVTALFAGLALFRAPYTLLVGAAGGLTGRLAEHVAAARPAPLRAFRTRVALLALLAPLPAAAFGALVGPWAVRLVFGPDVEIGALACALVSAACTAAMGNLLLGVLLLALDRAPALTRGWLLALLPGAAVLVVGGLAGAASRDGGEAATVLVAGALLATELAAVGLLSAGAGPRGRPGGGAARRRTP